MQSKSQIMIMIKSLFYRANKLKGIKDTSKPELDAFKAKQQQKYND